MGDLRWCCRCQHVSEPTTEPAPGGDVVCPVCGAGAANLQTWVSVRERNPHWPERPSPGKAFRVRKIREC